MKVLFEEFLHEPNAEYLMDCLFVVTRQCIAFKISLPPMRD